MRLRLSHAVKRRASGVRLVLRRPYPRKLVDLTQEERSSYNAAYEVYIGYVREQGLQRSHGAAWIQELKRLTTVETDARRAWLARRQALKLLEGCHGNFAALEALLKEYDGERMLVFTGSSEVAYTISRQYLVPAITRETEPVERKYIHDAFRTGRYTVVVTTEELKEGVDVSEAKVAIVLGGGARTRKYRRHLERNLSRNEPLQSTFIEVYVRDTIEDPVFIYEQSDQWCACHQASPEHQPHKL